MIPSGTATDKELNKLAKRLRASPGNTFVKRQHRPDRVTCLYDATFPFPIDK